MEPPHPPTPEQPPLDPIPGLCLCLLSTTLPRVETSQLVQVHLSPSDRPTAVLSAACPSPGRPGWAPSSACSLNALGVP